MSGKIIYSDDYFDLKEEVCQYYISIKRNDYSMKLFKEWIKEYPLLEVTQIINLSKEIQNPSGNWCLLGKKKDRVEIRLTSDLMKAYIRLNYTEKEFNNLSREAIVEEVIRALEEEDVIYGYDYTSLCQSLSLDGEILVAEGKMPARGKDARIEYYELKDPEPIIDEKGQTDYYEMTLINNVEKGDWLGERIEPTRGEDGKNVKGEAIPAQSGIQRQLKYDKKSIEAVKEQGTTTLYAKRNGAVTYEKDVITVCNYLEINGKVSFTTGNIDFDGYVGVADTVEDNFSVMAEKDIQVMGEMGVGAIDCIESKSGNIYIRGGISGKNRAKIICKGDFYTKFAADCDVECDGRVNIGYYALNCHIKAKEVILESSRSKIIGGHIEADVKIVAAELGSRIGVNTVLKINGYNRRDIKNRYHQVDEVVFKYNEKIKLIRQEMKVFESRTKEDPTIERHLSQLMQKQDQLLEVRNRLVENKKRMKSYLLTKGEGEIRATKKIHEKVVLEFKETIKRPQPSNLPMSYYYKNGMVHAE